MATIKSMGNQCSFFDGSTPLKITKKIRLIELFAGIGSQAQAIKNLGADFEHYRICEFDKYAVASYNAVHGTNFQTSDITKLKAKDLGIEETDKFTYIMTYSFPCTDLSKAGKQQGMSKDSGTRSGLLWEVERLLKELVQEGGQLPQILLMENVPDVISDKNKKDFFSWCGFLEEIGYTSKYALLNAKDFGVPQNRERCFMLSWLGDDYYYDFPEGKPLTKKLKDVLETEVEEKYYFRQDGYVGTLITDRSSPKHNNRVVDPLVWDGFNQSVRADSSCVGTLTRNCGADIKRNGQGIIEPIAYDEQNQYLRTDGCVGTLTTDGSSPKHNNRIVEPTTTRGSEIVSTLRASMHKQGSRNLVENLKNGRGYEGVIEPCNYVERAIIESGGVDCGFYSEQSPTFWYRKPIEGLARALKAEQHDSCVINNYRIRKLTPKECWRLMGFADEDVDNAVAVGMSNAQLYKQAGNSIVVDVLMAIFKNLF